jgi:hypothetical protein
MHTEELNGRSYARKGKKPNFKSTGSRFKINVLSSIANDGVKRHMTYSQTMKCRLFIMNMWQLIRSSNDHKVFLSFLTLGSTMGKWYKNGVSKHKSETTIFYLPAYCPDLNPLNTLIIL